jgi:hypothetical protein
MNRLDREKYLQLLRNQGLAAALAALHQDQENQAYEPLERDFNLTLNQFSRELWDIALREGLTSPPARIASPEAVLR